MKKNTLATKVLEDMIVYKIIVTQPCEEKKKKHPFLLALVNRITVFDMKKKCCCFSYSIWKYQL